MKTTNIRVDEGKAFLFAGESYVGQKGGSVLSVPGEMIDALTERGLDGWSVVGEKEAALQNAEEEEAALQGEQTENTSADSGETDITDAARDLAEKHNIDITTIEGTGVDGRVVLSDVQSLVPEDSKE